MDTGNAVTFCADHKTEAEGTAALTKEGFKVIKTEQSSAEYAKGTIISQSPEGNSIAPIESEVTIVLSAGGDGAEARMPQVLGNSKDAADILSGPQDLRPVSRHKMHLRRSAYIICGCLHSQTAAIGRRLTSDADL